MPQNNRFLSGYAGNPIQRTGRWFVDRLLPGNQRAADGTLDNAAVWKGAAVRGAGILANAVLPGSGTLVNQAGKNYINTGNVLPQFMQNGLNNYQQNQLAGGLSNIQRDMQMAINSRNGWNAPSEGVVGPATQLPAVQAQAPWQGTLANANPFGGQYGGNLGFGGGPGQRAIGGNLNYGGGRSGFNNGVGAGTGYGGGSVANTGFGSGSAAAGFGIGTGAASTSSPFALRDAMTSAKLNRV